MMPFWMQYKIMVCGHVFVTTHKQHQLNLFYLFLFHFFQQPPCECVHYYFSHVDNLSTFSAFFFFVVPTRRRKIKVIQNVFFFLINHRLKIKKKPEISLIKHFWLPYLGEIEIKPWKERRNQGYFWSRKTVNIFIYAYIS